MAETPDLAFVAKLKSLDDEAWRDLAGRCQTPLAAFVMGRFGCDRDSAEEIVQMAFVRAVRSIRTFDPARGTLLGWFKAIAANEGHTLARKQARRGAVSLSMPGARAAAVCESFDREPLPEEVLANAEFRNTVHAALDTLEEPYAQALIWKYADGLSTAEIATRTGKSDKAVESLLVRARAAFRRAFAAHADSGVRGEL